MERSLHTKKNCSHGNESTLDMFYSTQGPTVLPNFTFCRICQLILFVIVNKI